MDKYFGNDLLGIMRDRNALNLSQTTNFRLFQTDGNFKFDENGRKFPNRVKKNAVGKGETARYEQFLLFSQCFKRLVMQTCKNQGLFRKGEILFVRAGFTCFNTAQER